MEESLLCSFVLSVVVPQGIRRNKKISHTSYAFQIETQ